MVLSDLRHYRHQQWFPTTDMTFKGQGQKT